MTDPITIARAQAAIENGLIEALQSQAQADMDGTTVIVSRQACDEAAEFLPALYDEVKRLRADLEQGQRDYCDLMTRHDAHFVAWQSAKSRAEKAKAERDRLRAVLNEIASAASGVAHEIQIGPEDEGRDIYEMALAIRDDARAALKGPEE